jgi:hypothetical protein
MFALGLAQTFMKFVFLKDMMTHIIARIEEFKLQAFVVCIKLVQERHKLSIFLLSFMVEVKIKRVGDIIEDKAIQK